MLKNAYLVPGLERGLRLLQLVRPGHVEIAAPEIARELVVALKKNPASAFVSNVQVGTRMPAHATVLGRLLLQDVELRKLYPEARLKQYTPQTPKSVAELEKRIAQDRSRGYAVSESAYESGICAVAAPVRNHEQRAVAALSRRLSYREAA